MSTEKQALHHVLSQMLILAPVGITSDLRSAKVAEVMPILTALQRGKMKAADAHMIAEIHAGLPILLTSAGQANLALLAEEVILDLHGRMDEKKEEQPSPAPQSERKVDHDLPVHRGN